MSKKEFNLEDLDDLLNSNINEQDESDLDDPELLSQLQALSTPKLEKKKPAPKVEATLVKKQPQVQDMEIDIDAYHSLAQGNDNDIDVEFDERDMNDPNLLSQLSALGPSDDVTTAAAADTSIIVDSSMVTELTNMGFSVPQAKDALKKFDNNLERATNYLLDSPPSPPQQQQQLPEEEEEESTDPEFYKQKFQEYQKLALAAKKQGDKKKAIEFLRESKTFKQKYEDTITLFQPESTTQQPSRQEEEVVAQQQQQQQIQREQTPPISRQEQTPPSPSPPPMTSPQISIPAAKLEKAQETLSKVILLQQEYKKAALEYKKIGNVNVARQMIKTSKELLQIGIQLKNGEIFEANLPDSPDLNLGDGKIHQLTNNNNQDDETMSSTSQIENQLVYQLNVSHNLSIQKQQKGNNKVIMTNRDHFTALEHAIQADLLSLRSNNNQNNVPGLHFEQVNYTYQNVIDTVPLTMMEFNIIKATGLPTLDISTHLEPFVTWDFGGWPPENAAQAAMNKGETPIEQGIEPEFNFSTQIPITRTNRNFIRYLQRKKLMVEVFHNKYTYGFFRRPVSLGKAIIPMERLLTKSSISGSFDLLDNSRKKTGGKIQLQVNVREPLTCQDIVNKSERWLVLDAYGSTVSRCLAAADLTKGGPILPKQQTLLQELPTPSKITTPEIRVKTPDAVKTPDVTKTPDVVKTPEVVKAPEPPKAASGEDNLLEKAEEEFNSVDSIVSNMVLEHEMKLVNAQLSNSANKEDHLDRKQALEIKMNMLVIQVQTGLLDMDTYLTNVQKRMDDDRQLAIVFKKFNRLDLAKAALVRKKIMQDELEEARAAMEEQE